MKRLLLSVALVAISSSAFAQGVSPTRVGNKCFVLTDYRGYGYWDKCPSYHQEVQAPGRRGTITTITHNELPTGGADGGGGGGGGGGNR